MPYITLQVSQQGLLCDAFLGVSDARRHALQLAGRSVPPLVKMRAMIDTGASCTCVDLSMITPLSLTPSGAQLPMNTGSSGGTPFDADQYDVSLVIPPATTQDVAFRRSTIPVAEMPLVVSIGVDALIGRDVLSQCLLVYDGRSEMFSLAY